MNASSAGLTPQQQQALAEAAQWYAELTAESNTDHTRQDWQSWLLKRPENQWAWQQLEQLQQRFNQLSGELAFESLKAANDEKISNGDHIRQRNFSGVD
ncbi:MULTISPECIES: DUF4880 domain-containing protein [unclassified Methylophaga]|jgi:transmembrane sensor|uniref:DUF4880 domain-containing protein n=1 Tax=unclassified Methylophaga TaxID=2629249 RepID=UPI000C4F530C|nr:MULTISPECIES: DUF4880 domain-containing protein [unclassified Methylophaga]MBP25623.1 hypothetical protein [Methylophaga sp.]HCC80252.1 hypothetical protein [Methylophaga sp.]|tara:strand:- start:1844 stop:2140 length:297 start_codon:yes stop_codon:yes gene_type:complete